MTFIRAALFLLGIFAVTACEQQTAVSSLDKSVTACSAGEAQIRVSDGFFQNLCGCNEAAGTLVTAPGNLTCTVPVNTTVFFLYLSTHTEHQIISTGGIPFVSSPPSDPNPAQGQSFSVFTSVAGTSDFTDAFDDVLTGQLIITP